MPIKQVTNWPTEADFEADLQAALRRAFPWLPPQSIRHQTKFSFQWGHAKIVIDGRSQSQVTARADVLLRAKNPVASESSNEMTPAYSLKLSNLLLGLSSFACSCEVVSDNRPISSTISSCLTKTAFQ